MQLHACCTGRQFWVRMSHPGLAELPWGMDMLSNDCPVQQHLSGRVLCVAGRPTSPAAFHAHLPQWQSAPPVPLLGHTRSWSSLSPFWTMCFWRCDKPGGEVDSLHYIKYFLLTWKILTLITSLIHAKILKHTPVECQLIQAGTQPFHFLVFVFGACCSQFSIESDMSLWTHITPLGCETMWLVTSTRWLKKYRKWN